MPQKYKVFYNDSSIEIKPLRQNPNLRHAPSNRSGWVSIVNELFDSERPMDLLFGSSEPEQSLSVFKSLFTPIDAAGGLVLNAEGEMLAIHRLGKWDLPKGKVEEGEDIKETAVREVEEECGIRDPLLRNHILETFHLYERDGLRWFKTTHWYLMDHRGSRVLVPQKEEGIEVVVWVPVMELPEFYRNTYPNVRLVLEEVFDQIFTESGTNRV